MEKTDLSDAPRVVLLDNGSLSAEAVLQARSIASELSERIGVAVDAVSVLHSNRVKRSELDNRPALVWEDYLLKTKRQKADRLIVLPLFFGPSYGLRKAKTLASSYDDGTLNDRIIWGKPLAEKGDLELGEIMANDLIRLLDTIELENPSCEGGAKPIALLVDHGSPFEEVAACRDRLAEQLAPRLGDRVDRVIACSMERREGERYAFNDPLLADALVDVEKRGPSSILLSRLFLFPGRHAGPGGDIDSICQTSSWVQAGGEILEAPLLGTNPELVDLLESRYRSITGD